MAEVLPNLGRAYRYMGTRGLYRAAGFEDVPGADAGRPVVRGQIAPVPR